MDKLVGYCETDHLIIEQWEDANGLLYVTTKPVPAATRMLQKLEAVTVEVGGRIVQAGRWIGNVLI